MSQHYFHTKTPDHEPITVLLGWDRPLGHFFMVIESRSESAEDECLYSNLNDPQALLKAPLSYFREKLDAMGIKVPESMFSETLRDQAENVGNRMVMHYPDDTFKEQ